MTCPRSREAGLSHTHQMKFEGTDERTHFLSLAVVATAYRYANSFSSIFVLFFQCIFFVVVSTTRALKALALPTVFPALTRAMAVLLRLVNGAVRRGSVQRAAPSLEFEPDTLVALALPERHAWRRIRWQALRVANTGWWPAKVRHNGT